MLFVSPDGQWVGFVSGRMVNKISVEGASAVARYRGDAPPRTRVFLSRLASVTIRAHRGRRRQ
jgi:hypothetical protein